ncbi:hypothetical protein WJ976_12705 [Achromobacter denitrificans]
MPAGMQVWNAYSELIVDGPSITMFLRHAGAMSSSVVLPASDPVVFFRPLGSEPTYLTAIHDGATLTLTAGNRPAEYYVFDRPVEGSYLDVFDGNGAQIFTAAQRPLNVVGSVTVGNYYDAYRTAYADGWTYSGLVGGKYAYNAAFVRRGFDSSPLPGGGWQCRIRPEGILPTANGFFTCFTEQFTPIFGWSPTNANNFISYEPTCHVSIIDVAGIL